MSTTQTPFTVLIIGGGVAGLTLALSLQHANIEYLLLEGRSEITPQVGASIGILPHGARILDQLGVWEDLLSKTAQFATDTTWIDNGKKLHQLAVSDLVEARLGYQGCFVQRMEFLRSVYGKIVRKEKVLTGQRVVKIEHSEKGVVVRCENGKVYRGDVVVGADGVHSVVREEMRKLVDHEEGKDVMKKDRNSLYADYALLYGIADAVPGVEEGDIHRSYFKGHSFLTIGGINTCYFFCFKKLDKRYHAPHIPRFSDADAEKCANEFAENLVNDTVKFGEIWKRRKSSGMAPTEEAQNDHWTWGRFVCIGDSIHKITPNAGQGGNAAMESAAALASSLQFLLSQQKDEKKPSFQDIKSALKEFHDSRKVRSELISKESNDFTRIEALDTWKDELTARHLLPNFGDFIADRLMDSVCGATRVRFLPEPKRARGTLLGFNENFGVGNEESLWWRVGRALPLLMITVLAWWCMREKVVPDMLKHVDGILEKGGFVDGERIVEVRSVFTGVKWLDWFVRNYVFCFTPSMVGVDETMSFIRPAGQEVNLYAPGRLQMLTFLTDITPILAIWLIESHRRGNILTPIRQPLPFLLATQHLGIGIISPLLSALHSILIPPSKYRSLDNRLVSVPHAKTLLPALLLGYLLPTALSYLPTSSIPTLQAWNFVWQLFPLLLLSLHSLLSRCLEDTTVVDKWKNPTVDLPYLRATYVFTALVSTIVFNYVRAVSPVPLAQLFLKDLGDPWTEITSFVQGVNMLLRYDHVFAFLGMYGWIWLCFADLKREGKVSASWGVIVGGMALGTWIVGPGATVAVMAAWREELWARR